MVGAEAGTARVDGGGGGVGGGVILGGRVSSLR